jgi:hypothetical protein
MVNMISWFELVMNSERNPLRHFAPPQRFQIMCVLSVMWTTIFCTAFGLWFLYGELIVGHLLLALGTLITGTTFQQARRVATYRSYPKSDGTARYDDVRWA